jgi:hypothetical protein
VQYVAHCPFRLATVLWQARPGAWTLTACVKVTLTLVHEGEATLAEEQDGPSDARTWGDDPRASLRTPGDYLPIKRRVDVLVTGHAHAPPGRGPTESLVARLRVGDLEKALRVTGDRVWTAAGGGFWPSAPQPFTSMPLRFERAARGAENPVGLDPGRARVAGAPAMPNLEPIEAGQGEARVAGFGPISPDWPARLGLLGSDGWAWAQGFHAGAIVREPAPMGFDFRFFNAAPRDQQLDALRATTTLALEHLHPRHARLVTRLPAMRPRVVHETRGGQAELGLRCDTLLVDADRGVVVVSWRGSTELANADPRELGRLVLRAEANGQPLRFPAFERGAVLEEVAPGVRFDAPPRAAAAGPRFGPPPSARRNDDEATAAFPIPVRPAAFALAAPTTALPPLSAQPAAEPPRRPSWAERPRLDNPPLPKGEGTIAIALTSLQRDDAGTPSRGAPPRPAAGRPAAPPPPPASARPAAPAPPPSPSPAPPPSFPPPASARTRPPAPPPRPSQGGARAPEPTPAPDSTVAAARPATAAPATITPVPVIALGPAPLAARVDDVSPAPPPASTRPPPDVPAPPPSEPTRLAEPHDDEDAGPRSSQPAALPFAAAARGVSTQSGSPLVLGRARRVADPNEDTSEIHLDTLARPVIPFATSPDEALDETNAPTPAAPPAREDAAIAASLEPRRVAWWEEETPEPEAPAPHPPSSSPPPPVAVEPPPLLGAPLVPRQAASSAPASAAPTAEASVAEDEGRRDLAIEEYAAVRAELRERPAERDAIFRARGLTPASWRAVDEHWSAALSAETRRGRTALLARFDDAYVDAMATLRAPIGVEQYARLAVALELGDIDPALAELSLDRADLMRLSRVWTRRTLADPRLAAEVRRAIGAARDVPETTR